MWPREIPQFSARNLKHHPGSELGALEVEFELGRMRNLILPNFKKSTSIRVHMQKLRPFYRSMSGLWFWKAEYDSESKSGKTKTYCL
jgi:hypothetical protein